MASPRLCVVSGRSADVTACLLSQILSPRGRTGLAALTGGFAGGAAELLRALEDAACRYAVLGLPEDRDGAGLPTADTAVLLTRGTGEAAAGLAARCRNAVVNLDDPDGVVPVPAGAKIWRFSERRDEAEVTAKNLRLLPFRTEFEAVTDNAICRLSVPLPDGRGLYPGLAAATAALSLGIPLEETARRLRTAEPVPVGMIPLAGAGQYAAAGYFEPNTERIREI